ncbi:trypco2 family protein [Halomonas sp.]|uniref:trypco2 family protein n=1 Tax=Halomonas sp. TaxID=1486246 RepID=UPI00257BE056|nr:trypco2 family protein [Halomonas sp.]MCJ8286612.1 hypothetical protein [Halomonas sp.]NQY71324.1 hypothetical protein [Halomonas sp.]
MELKDFIRETLVQVAQGIEEASSELQDSTALVNPRNVSINTSENGRHYGVFSEDKAPSPIRYVEEIAFDVAVHATEGTEASAKAGISVGSVGIGGKGSSSETKSSASRIQFRVPMVMPQT